MGYWGKLGFLSVLSVTALLMLIGWADIQPAQVVLSTPMSSRINSVGYRVQGVLTAPLKLPDGTILPTGTAVVGRLLAVEPYRRVKQSGRLRLAFTDALLPNGQIQRIRLLPDTPDGWLTMADGALSVWTVMPGHSTRLLNTLIQRRLPCDRSLWSQILGINSNSIPDPTSDEFMIEYNRHDVLIGAGDWLRVKPSPNPEE